MADAQSVATLIDSATSKIQQLQEAFAELENYRAVSLNLKWKELEAHFHGLERSLKRRFDELEGQEKEYENKASETQEMLVNREAAVMAKEHASLERLQQKRDAALSAIGDTIKKYKTSPSQPISVNIEVNCSSEEPVEEKPPDTKDIVVDSEEVKKIPENENMDACPQLTKLCEQMDSKGLHKFISDNRKNLPAIRENIPLALATLADPARLVLDSLENFYLVEPTSLDGKRDSNLLGLRRTCIMLMECLAQLLSDTEHISFSDIITDDIKEQAKAIAVEWKPKLDDLDGDASSGNSLEAHAFLQLLATFDIASDFDQEDILKLIPTVSRRRQTADLCRSLGLSDKMPGVIEVMVNSGRNIDAVNMAYAFELTEQFSPVPLLKSYLLKEARKSSSPTKSGNIPPSAQNEVNERELIALKAVVKCIEEHKLEKQYPVEPLQKRVIQLEKAKADKKRVGEAAKPQPKRPRANGGSYGPHISSNLPDKSFYPTPAPLPERYPAYKYDNRHYFYQAPSGNSHPSSLLGSATYGLSPNHGTYYSNGYQYHQATYMH